MISLGLNKVLGYSDNKEIYDYLNNEFNFYSHIYQ